MLETIRSFDAAARELLLDEDEDYRAKVIGHRALKANKKDGMKHLKAVLAAEDEVKAEGLPDPELRGLADLLRD